MASLFDNSDAGVRAKRIDQEAISGSLASLHTSRHDSLFSMRSEGSSSVGMPVRHTNSQVRNVVTPAMSTIGFSTAADALRSTASGMSGHLGARSTLTSCPNGASQQPNHLRGRSSLMSFQSNSRPSSKTGSHPLPGATPPHSTSNFMDAYRLSKNGIAHHGIQGVAAAHHQAHPAPVSLSRFQAKNEDTISNILSVVPPDRSTPRLSGTGKKRLGMGRPGVQSWKKPRPEGEE